MTGYTEVIALVPEVGSRKLPVNAHLGNRGLFKASDKMGRPRQWIELIHRKTYANCLPVCDVGMRAGANASV